MMKILASLFIGLCIFLGTLSGQAKSYKIIAHISAEHSSQKLHHHHEHQTKHHDHGHHTRKNSSKSHEREHTTQLSFSSFHPGLPSYTGFIHQLPLGVFTNSGFYTLNILNQLSFSPPVFRPPIV